MSCLAVISDPHANLHAIGRFLRTSTARRWTRRGASATWSAMALTLRRSRSGSRHAALLVLAGDRDRMVTHGTDVVHGGDFGRALELARGALHE